MISSRSPLFGVALLVLLSWLCACASAVTVDAVQKQILYQIRSEMPSLETLSSGSWTNDAIDDICNTFNLYGVQACNATGWVTEIRFFGLIGVDLGQLGTSLGNLSALTKFQASTTFSGTLPASLGQLTQLTAIRISNNVGVHGPLPYAWRTLKLLNTFNWIGSTTPTEFPTWIATEWPALENFVWDNLGTSGPFPTSILSLSKLKTLSLKSNKFSGPLPSALGSLTFMQWLYLYDNQFSGELPASVAALPSLATIDVSYNRLNGSLPTVWPSISLWTINIHHNQFSGNLPPSLPSVLFELRAYSNQFTGAIPASYFGGPFFNMLMLANNSLTSIAWPANPQSSRLAVYSVAGNTALQGTIPSTLWQLTQLRELNLDNTQVTGPLPNSIPPNCKLQTISANNSPIGGALPSRFDYCPYLFSVSLQNSGLHGAIPSSFSNLTKVISINLAGNDLNGTLFTDWSQLTKVQELNLSGNRLSGSVPKSLVSLSTDQSLDELFLQNNRLELCDDQGIAEGDIPNTLSCDVTGQTATIDSQCTAIWSQCLTSTPSSEPNSGTNSPGSQHPSLDSQDPTSPSSPSSSSPAPSTASPTGTNSPADSAAPSTISLPSWFPTQSHATVAFLASIGLILIGTVF